MMQTAKTGQGDDIAIRAEILLRQPVPRRFFPQAKMRPVPVVIADVVVHEAFEMPFVENDYVIEQLAPTTANEPFRNAILPRTSETGPFRLEADFRYCMDYFPGEVRSPIKDQVFGSAVEWEGVAQLLSHPRSRRMLGRVAMKNPPPVVGDDKKAVRHTEGWIWIPGRLPHATQHSALGNIETQLFQFAMNARRSAGSILSDHAED
jgi:hypothetical protein